MATQHTIGVFEPSKESWVSYIERLEQFFIATDVATNEKKRAILLSGCGPHAYRLIQSLVLPAKPGSKSFDELVKLMKEHQMPPPNPVLERFKFHTRSRQQGESMADFVASLRRLSEHCEFGDGLDDLLRDRLICGCNEDRLQKNLLAKTPPPNFKVAIAMAQAMESADKDTKDLQNSRIPAEVHAIPRNSPPPRGQTNCYRCGGKHTADDCRFKEAVCHFCKKKGHIARVCRSKAKQQRGGKTSTSHKSLGKTNVIHIDEKEVGTEYTVNHVDGTKKSPYTVELSVNGAPLKMEVDTGAAVSLISEATYKRLWKNPPKLKPTTTRLRTYSGQQLVVLGTLVVNVEYETQQVARSLIVVKGSGPSLLGRDWLTMIRLDWKSLSVHQTSTERPLKDILKRHESLFRPELGLARNIDAKLYVEPDAIPRFCNARPVPYALREKVENELNRLQADGIIEPVQFAEWAAPIVPVLKPDGTARICGDYKLTVNKAAKLDAYPIPRIEDLFARLAGGKKFTKLDIAHAYQQIPLDEDSRSSVTINTHKGLFRYNRLPFGVHSAPAIFQRAMEGLLRDIPSTVVYLDDILITGKTEEEHLQNIDEVMTRLEDEGLTLKKEKCQFMLDKVEYLGHTISADGLKPSESKTRAIVDAPQPQNVSQLRSFLGMVNYYGKFLPKISTKLAPMYRLLKKGVPWRWGSLERGVFESIKKQLAEAPVLEHYDPSRKLSLATDASPYGVGAVLSHVLEDGTEKPVAYASRTLSPVEKRYSQLDKEALAIVFGVKRFHQYLFGRQFSIVSDHKPLQYLLSENKAVPVMASARLQRWALILSSYQYTITYRPGEKIANADGLSRLPLPEAPSEVPYPGEVVFLLQTLQSSPITAEQIKHWTNKDPVLSRVRNLVSKGWIDCSDDVLRPYQNRKDELSMLDGCVLWGSRVIVPVAGRAPVLDLLHDGHPGISKMKAIARNVVWWPGIDADLVRKVQECEPCQINQKSPTLAPLHTWEWPKRPWSRIHIDHAGPFQGKTILVVVDAHSKWIEAVPVPSTSSLATITVLRNLFATHGIPELIFSDNGTSFTSDEFKEFVRRNGIRHRTSAPYHPATNGLAERAVQVVKTGLRKNAEGDMGLRLARLLFKYRNTPHATTGVTPAELLLGRKPRCHLDLLHPDIAARVEIKQSAQKSAHDGKQKARKFAVSDTVFVKNFQSGEKWLPGIIAKVLGTRTYLVKLNLGKTVRRHLNHVKARKNDAVELPKDDFIMPPIELSDEIDTPELPDIHIDEPVVRRSTRHTGPPDRYTPGV